MFDFLRIDDKLKAEDVEGVQWDARRHKFYGNTKVDNIFLMYILALVIWTVIIIYIQSDVGFFILLIPIIVFVISMISLNRLSMAVEDEMFQINFLSTGMLIILPLLSCIINEYDGNKDHMVRVILMAITFTILSMIDVWVPEKWLSMLKHVRSILQTISLTLILYALYMFYCHMGTFPVLNRRS